MRPRRSRSPKPAGPAPTSTDEVGVSLTIPAHNESANIGAVVTSAREVLARFSESWEIVLVDDGSDDGTVEAAQQALGDDASRLRAVRHRHKSGYAVTVCDGLRASRGKVLAFMDGDGQFDARDLELLLQRLDMADLVAGVRARRADPWYRLFVAGVYNFVVRTLFGIRERDFDCGLKVMTREFYDAASPIHARSAVFNPELYFKAHRMGFRVLQVPVKHLPRLAGVRSGGRLIPVLRALRDVFRLRVWLAFRWHPARAGRRPRLWLWTLPGIAVLTLLRIPSLLEPHWYTDEASYVSTGQSLLHGHVLYSQIWSNKPPLQIWTVASVVGVFGPSEVALHVLTLASGLLTAAAVGWAALRLLGPAPAAIGTLVAGVVLGLPVLDAELAIPESLLIAPLSWAGAMLLVSLAPARGSGEPRRPRRWPIAVGVLTAAAIAYQQTALAEACAFGVAIALSPRASRRDFLAYVGTAGGLTLAWVAVAMISAGPGSVAYALGWWYAAYTQSVLPSSAAGAAWHLGEVALGGLLLIGGAVLQRRGRSPFWILVLWLGASLGVPALANQPYPHYLEPAAAPVALAVAVVVAGAIDVVRRRVAVGLGSAARLAPAVAGLGVVASMASIAGLDWVPAASSSPLVNTTRTLSQYYGEAISAVGTESQRHDWDYLFDARVPADEDVARWIEQEGLSGSTAVIWSSDTWLYPLAGLQVLMPTPPIYNDEVLLGINGPVERYVAALSPELIIVSIDEVQEFPEINQLLQGDQYQPMFESDPDVVWVRSDIAGQLS